MSKTTTLLAGRKRVAILFGLLLSLALVMAGCGGEPTAPATAAPTEPPEPTEVAAATATATTVPTEPPPTEAPTEAPTEPPPTATATATATAAPTEEPTPVPIDDTACIDCHMDAESLQALATEPEAPEVESEGEG
jgi:outer membrane biosynthesis protein TonB